MSELTYPRELNPAINLIIDDAVSRGVIRNRGAVFAALEMSPTVGYSLTRENPNRGWRDEDLRRLMSIFVTLDADDLATRILKLMFPGFAVGFRSDFLGAAEPGPSIFADEGRVVTAIGELTEAVAESLADDESPGEIDPVEADRIRRHVDRAQSALNSVTASIERHVQRKRR